MAKNVRLNMQTGCSMSGDMLGLKGLLVTLGWNSRYTDLGEVVMEKTTQDLTRTTRALSNVNENLVKRTAAGKDAQLTRRPALKDQRNGANIPAADRAGGKPIAKATRSVAAKPTASHSLQKQEVVADRVHPEVTGIEREIQFVEYCDQVYQYLLAHEKKTQLEEEFMVHSPSTPKMRSILVDWLIQVHTRFHLLPETLHLTIYLLDIMLSRTKVDKNELQLVGVASMLVASKYEEMYAPDIHDFEYITDNAYNKKMILKMEAKILIAADFDLSRPHSLTFLRWFSKEMKFGMRMHHMAKYLIEMAFLDASLSPVLPSHTACACTYIAARLCDSPYDSERMKKMTGITLKEAEELGSRFAKVFLRLHSLPKLLAVREKYSSAKVLAVSQLYDSDIKILTELSS
ncbi:cyclin domain protein [Ancylostoma ceylanicum]|uniref:Cyclin domain protein n=1 Tax=Ancylostoma ceylanicum TaxID=53326 RepID=A0A0D6LKC7_9BILA|nr:cyclin domain protein [Ancylostoma ceylanicum]